MTTLPQHLVDRAWASFKAAVLGDIQLVAGDYVFLVNRVMEDHRAEMLAFFEAQACRDDIDAVMQETEAMIARVVQWTREAEAQIPRGVH